jgi:hypothetical protein
MTEDMELIAASDSLSGLKRAAMEWANDSDMQIVSDWIEQGPFSLGGNVWWRLEATAADLEPGETFDPGLIAEQVEWYPSNEG